MNTKIIGILSILSLTMFFNVLCMTPGTGVNQRFINGAATGKLEEVQDALKQGADINFKGSLFIKIDERTGVRKSTPRITALSHASSNGHFNIVKYLVKSGADINNELPGWTAPMFAINNYNEIAKFLIEAGADKQAVLFFAIDKYNLNFVKFLVWLGVDINKKHSFNFSPQGNPGCRNAIESAQQKSLAARPEDIQEAVSIFNFLNNYALKLKNIQNKNLEVIVKKVNEILKHKINEQINLPPVLNDIVVGYSLYPENYEEFFDLSEQQIDELIKIYVDEFENKDMEDENEELFLLELYLCL